MYVIRWFAGDCSFQTREGLEGRNGKSADCGMWEEIWLPVLSHYVWGKNCIENQREERERDKK